MARLEYYVVKRGAQWFIHFQDKDYGPHATQRDAFMAAAQVARDSGANGHDAQVLIQGRDNKWQTEWTYGHDPYPPKG